MNADHATGDRPIVVFDLDGTLVDTAPDLLGALNVILTGEGLTPIDPEDTRRAGKTGKPLISYGARYMLARAFSFRGRDLDDDTIERHYTDFVAVYRERIARLSRPFPGAETALEKLAREGFLLAVCTNKQADLARKLLDDLDLARHFSVIVGPDTFGVKKPDPEHILKTIAAAGGDRRRAIMVGDSAPDIDAAKAAGVFSIAVTFGYCDGPIDTLGADRVVGDYAALTDAILAREPAAVD